MSEDRALPTREQIEAMTDVAALEALREDIDKALNLIEADLEFRSDGDLDWERRACSALAYHRMAMGQLCRRIGRLTGRTQASVAEQAALRQAKATRAAAQVAAEALALEKRKVVLAEAQLKLERQKEQNQAQKATALDKRRGQALANIQDLSWQKIFVRVARSMVDADLFAAISEEATRLQAEVIEQQTRAVVRLDEAA